MTTSVEGLAATPLCQAMVDDAHAAVEALKTQLAEEQARTAAAQLALASAERAAHAVGTAHEKELHALRCVGVHGSDISTCLITRQEIRVQEAAMESLEAAGADALRRADEASQQLLTAQSLAQECAAQVTALQAKLASSKHAEAAARARVEALEQATEAGLHEITGLQTRLAAAEQGCVCVYVSFLVFSQ